MIRLLPIAIACCLLGACDKGTPPPAQGDDRRSAEGEVLGGSVSDAMIPLDTLTSAAPPLRESGTATTSGASATDSAKGAEAPSGSDTTPATPAPAATAEGAANGDAEG